jgi:hypothetical protein
VTSAPSIGAPVFASTTVPDSPDSGVSSTSIVPGARPITELPA